MTSFVWLQNSIDLAVSWNKCFIVYRTIAAKKYVVCRNTAQVVKLEVIPGNDQNASPTNQKTAVSNLERTSTDKLADALWLSEASKKLFR